MISEPWRTAFEARPFSVYSSFISPKSSLCKYYLSACIVIQMFVFLIEFMRFWSRGNVWISVDWLMVQGHFSSKPFIFSKVQSDNCYLSNFIVIHVYGLPKWVNDVRSISACSVKMSESICSFSCLFPFILSQLLPHIRVNGLIL